MIKSYKYKDILNILINMKFHVDLILYVFLLLVTRWRCIIRLMKVILTTTLHFLRKCYVDPTLSIFKILSLELSNEWIESSYEQLEVII